MEKVTHLTSFASKGRDLIMFAAVVGFVEIKIITLELKTEKWKT